MNLKISLNYSLNACKTKIEKLVRQLVVKTESEITEILTTELNNAYTAKKNPNQSWSDPHQ